MSRLRDAYRILREEGPTQCCLKTAGHIYRHTVRRALPSRGEIYYNDVRTGRKHKPLDSYLPIHFHYADYAPHMEGGIVSAHERLTRPGDSVVVVGGGNGVSTVRAARIVGESGSVRVYEGGKQSVRRCERIAELNDVADRCRVEQAVVGTGHAVYGGETAGADIVHPADLPECDVLELDCEGAETDILAGIAADPQVVIAELHPWLYPEPTERPLELLAERGYETVYRSGHDGVEATPAEFGTLLHRSRDQRGTRNPKGEGDKYVDSGAKWPVIVGATVAGRDRRRDGSGTTEPSVE